MNIHKQQKLNKKFKQHNIAKVKKLILIDAFNIKKTTGKTEVGFIDFTPSNKIYDYINLDHTIFTDAVLELEAEHKIEVKRYDDNNYSISKIKLLQSSVNAIVENSTPIKNFFKTYHSTIIASIALIISILTFLFK